MEKRRRKKKKGRGGRLFIYPLPSAERESTMVQALATPKKTFAESRKGKYLVMNDP